MAIFSFFGVKPKTGEEKVIVKEQQEINVTSYNQSGGITANTVTINTPRELSQNNEDLLRETLKTGPVGKIKIYTPISGGDEISHIQAQLEKILVVSGWTINGHSLIPMKPQLTGIYMQVHSNATPPERAVWLQQALKKVGISADALYQEDHNLDQDDVVLWIARKA